MVIRDKNWSKKASALYEVQIKIKMLKDKEKSLSIDLVIESKKRDSKFEGFEFKKIEKNGAIRYSTVPAIKEMDLESYRGDSFSYWRLYKKF